MITPPVFFVHLRQPRSRDDSRDDPFYEFGSFGCTGCHRRNLLHIRHREHLKGARLAFVQGGGQGSRLVFLTPPIMQVKRWPDRCEVTWKPAEMPFKYAMAPILVRNDGYSDFPLVRETIAFQSRATTVYGKRLSLELRFASKLRSLVTPLDDNVAKQVIAVYEKKRREALRAPHLHIASTYDQALPRVICGPGNRLDRYREARSSCRRARRHPPSCAKSRCR